LAGHWDFTQANSLSGQIALIVGYGSIGTRPKSSSCRSAWPWSGSPRSPRRRARPGRRARGAGPGRHRDHLGAKRVLAQVRDQLAR